MGERHVIQGIVLTDPSGWQGRLDRAALSFEKEAAEAPWAELSVRTLRPTSEIDPLSESQETTKNRRICRTGVKV